MAFAAAQNREAAGDSSTGSMAPPPPPYRPCKHICWVLLIASINHLSLLFSAFVAQAAKDPRMTWGCRPHSTTVLACISGLEMALHLVLHNQQHVVFGAFCCRGITEISTWNAGSMGAVQSSGLASQAGHSLGIPLTVPPAAGFETHDACQVRWQSECPLAFGWAYT